MAAPRLCVCLSLWVLQVCDVGGASVLNGIVGESIVLPTGVDEIDGSGLLQWTKGSTVIVQYMGREKTLEDKAFTGRLTMNSKTGSLTINPLREDDSGEYGFNGDKPRLTIKINLLVYERIVSVQVNAQVSYSSDNSTCNVTLSCSVNGSSQVALSWSRDGERIPGEEDRQTVMLPHTGQIYSCTASNPVSSQTASVTVTPCQEHDNSDPLKLIIIVASGMGGLVVIIVVVICIFTRRKKGETEQDATVYAEVGEPTQKDVHSGESKDINTCYAVVKHKASAGQHSPHITDVSTCYDVIQNTENAAAPPSLYDTVNFNRVGAISTNMSSEHSLRANQYQHVL
ncbi:SLAM family member 5-like [Megalops cyprinoides]|uniref:SLAM family member 5-like n=1 Tax=Megalops cyprinoides TaxID=118141 RepID=UPI0018642831|nr:SLAM family member 5-like [Megalops cyprinoides]